MVVCHKQKAVRMKKLETLVQIFISKVKRKQIAGSFNVAKETAEILRILISKSRFATLSELIDAIKDIGRKLQQAAPLGTIHALYEL